MDNLEVATVCIFSIWFLYVGSCIRALGSSDSTRAHALAKLVLAILLSFGVYGLMVHWTLAAGLFAISFFVYMRSRRQLAGRRTFHALNWYDWLR